MFDVRAQFDGHCRHRLCRPGRYPLPAHSPPCLSGLCDEHPISPATSPPPGGRQQEQERAVQLGQQNLAEFILTCIAPDHLQLPLIVESSLSLLAATEAMVARGTDCLLYPGADGSLSLATCKTLLHALTLKGLPLSAPLAVLTPTPLTGLPLGSYLFDALLLMTRHRIKRLVIWQAGQVAGILH